MSKEEKRGDDVKKGKKKHLRRPVLQLHLSCLLSFGLSEAEGSQPSLEMLHKHSRKDLP